MFDWAVGTIFFIIGNFIGSFLNVVSDRLYRQENFLTDTSNIYKGLDIIGFQEPVSSTLGQKGMFLAGNNIDIIIYNINNIPIIYYKDKDIIFHSPKQSLRKLQNFNDPIATGSKGELKALFASMSDDLDNAIKEQKPELGEAIDVNHLCKSTHEDASLFTMNVTLNGL